MQTKTAVLYEIGKPRPYGESKPLVIETLQLDEPGPDEVVVRIKAAGLCHSDLSVIDGSRIRPVPMGIGHEAAGFVESIGSNVKDLPVGTRVILVFVPSCGDCIPCSTGRPALCEPGAVANGKGELLDGGVRWYKNGKPIFHQLGVSAFSERVVVSRKSCIPIDLTEEELSYQEMALFGCGVLTGAGAVFNTAKPSPGTTSSVVGLGGVGLSTLLALKAAGASVIAAVDLVDEKLEMAKELGATHTFNPSRDNVETIRKATGGKGFENVFEMAGSIPALDLAYAITGRGGTTITAGLPHPSKTLNIPAVTLVAEERTLKGSYIGSAIPKRDIPRLIQMYRQGILPVNKLLDGEISLEEINQGFEKLAEGKVIRQVVIM